MMKITPKLVMLVFAPMMPVWIAYLAYRIGFAFLPEVTNVNYSFGQFSGYFYGFWLAALPAVLVSMVLIFRKIFLMPNYNLTRDPYSDENVFGNEVQERRFDSAGPVS